MRKQILFLAALFSATVMNLHADVDTLYLNTGGSSLWNQAGAKFSVWYWNDGAAGKFTDFLELAYGETDIYRAIIPRSDSVIFVRHAATADVPSWDNKLNYTEGEDIKLEDNGNMMIVNDLNDPSDHEWDRYTPKAAPVHVTFEETGSKADITTYLSQKVNVTIARTLYKDGERNTICLPFAVSADSLQSSTFPLYGCTLEEFTSAEIKNPGEVNETLELTMSTASAIEAGKPYSITWTSGENIVSPVFNGVTITTDEASASSEVKNVTFVGTFVPYEVEKDDKGIMFVGLGGTLNWPNVGGNINGFRCYFTVDLDAPSSPLRQGMNAILTDGHTIPAENAEFKIQNSKLQKLIQEGRVVIISNGVRYNLQGQIVK